MSIQAYPKHDEDFYGWVHSQIALLKQHKLEELDVNYLIEELESMGASEKRALISRLAQLTFHLLKWDYQKHLRSRSWEYSIKEQRVQVSRLLEDNPGLKPKLGLSFTNAYSDALILLGKETPIDLKTLPSVCPYSIEDLMNDEFYPE